MDLGHHILAVDDYRCISGRAQSDMQNRSILRDINFLASKHRVDPRSQAGFLCQLKEELESFVGDAILRVVEVETHGLQGQALAAFRVIGKELSKMGLPHLLIVGFERLPRWARGEWLDCCRHSCLVVILITLSFLEVWHCWPTHQKQEIAPLIDHLRRQEKTNTDDELC
jgi:hypothetical protein